MATPKLTQQQVAERRAKAVQLRMAGATAEEIAVSLQYGGRTDKSRRDAVHMDLKRAFEAANRNRDESVEQYRALELDRLDRLQRGSWQAAVGGDPKAVASVLAILDRRCKLLGLDAPVKVDTTVTETTQVDVEFAELVREAQARSAAEEAALRGDDAGGPPGR